MIILKTPAEIEKIRAGGAILSRILTELVSVVRPGITTGEIELLAEKRMREAGGEPSFKGYKTDPRIAPFNSALCLSLDDEVVHGPAYPSRVVPEGSILKLDIGLRYQGMCTDMAVTVPVGKVSEEKMKLIRVTKESLLLGVEKAVAGGWVSDIGRAVDKHVRKHGFTTVKDLTGHGVGHHVHEDPRVPNYFDPSMEPVRLVKGLVIAIEPMVNAGEEDVYVKDDDWTFATSDRKLSAHFELTLAITDQGTEIMTPLPDNA
jgi:methionyl aminopeptidase